MNPNRKRKFLKVKTFEIALKLGNSIVKINTQYAGSPFLVHHFTRMLAISAQGELDRYRHIPVDYRDVFDVTMMGPAHEVITVGLGGVEQERRYEFTKE